MKYSIAPALVLLALPLAAFAEDREEQDSAVSEGVERCVSATVLVPPFNNSPGALEQSRIAATTVEKIRNRRGEPAYRVCRTSAIAPELSEIEGVREKVLTEDEMRQLDPETVQED